MKRIHQTVDPRTLVDHPLNKVLYGAGPPDDDFIASIKRLGVLTPVEITKDGVVISGHRRRLAAILVGLPRIEVLVHVEDLDDLVIRQRIIESNRNRIKTVEQRAREYAELVRVEKELAKERMEAGRTSGKFPEDPDGPLSTAGEAKQIAAAKVGLGRNTAEKAALVVQKIDEAEAAGQSTKAAELRQELNKGTVASAHRKATGQADGPKHKSATSPGALVDENNQRVPQGLCVVFQARREFDAVADLLRRASTRAQRLTQQTAGACIASDQLKLDLENASQNLGSARPNLICPACNADGSSCDSCHSRGWLPHGAIKGAGTSE